MVSSSNNNATILLFLAEDWFFLSHFLDRARAAQQAGYRVVVAARDNGSADEIRALNFEFVAVPINRRSLNPFSALIDLIRIRAILRRVSPDIVHNVAMKPILLGTFAALSLGIRRIVNAPVGMGFVHSSQTLTARLLRPILNLALRFALNPPGSKVILENDDDLNALVSGGSVRDVDARLIAGAGVDVASFNVQPEPALPPVVVLAARMLVDKGVREFVDAARILRRSGVAVRMQLVGAPDPMNPSSISGAEIEGWAREGSVEYLGHRDDMAQILANSHVACLPSYREGLSKFLLEAMASGKPIVTTDVPGCRQAVRDGINGLLVPARHAESLAAALASLCSDAALRHRMGTAGRQFAVDVFASEHIGRQTIAVYDELMDDKDNSEPARPPRAP